jgi:hypothetical protein
MVMGMVMVRAHAHVSMFTEILFLDALHNTCVSDTWGFPQFTPHSALAHNPVQNTQYLKDDTLYFRVSVKVADHKPWLEM